jgi:hypothetical protein
MTGGRDPEVSIARLYRFVQWEFPWQLGPEDGRYVLRDHAGEEPHHVLVLSTRQPPSRRGGGLRGRRPRDASPEPDTAHAGLTRVTLIDAQRVEEDEARAWLDGAHDDLLPHLNHAIRAHRVATADPYVHEVSTRDALVVRVGYGAGEEVADGRWTEAREIPRPADEGSRRARRQAALRPQERLAALLSARDAILACEDLALRARLDLEHGRAREACLQAHLAFEAAVAELQAFRDQGDMAERLADLTARRDALADAANEALQGGPSAETIGAVDEALGRLEAALRARAASARW